MGTPKFIVYMTVFVVVWIAVNLIGLFGLRWDPYPFILLNLAFSTQAAYAAPLILLAQNRQADRDRAQTETDRQVVARTQADTEYLAREVVSIRRALQGVATADELSDAVERITELLTARPS